MQLAVRSFLDITALLGALLSIVVPRGRLTNLFVLPLRKSLYWKWHNPLIPLFFVFLSWHNRENWKRWKLWQCPTFHENFLPFSRKLSSVLSMSLAKNKREKGLRKNSNHKDFWSVAYVWYTWYLVSSWRLGDVYYRGFERNSSLVRLVVCAP